MTPDEATDLAARTLAAIDATAWLPVNVYDADRERVGSDLAGLRECHVIKRNFVNAPLRPDHEAHAARYADGLRRTAALYGVTP